MRAAHRTTAALRARSAPGAAALLAALLAAGCLQAPGPPSLPAGLSPSPPTLVISQGNALFTATAGGVAPPPQNLTGSVGPGVLFSGTAPDSPVNAAVTYATGAGWLQATISGSSYSFDLELAADPAGLAAGIYQATVTVTGSGSIAPTSASVTLAVGAAGTRILEVARANVGIGLDPTPVTATVLGAGGPPLVALEDPASGNWVFVGVPQGPVELRVESIPQLGAAESVLVDTDADLVDLGAVDLAGRLQAPPDGPATAIFDWHGLQPWATATDSIQLYAPDPRVSARFVPAVLSDGATTTTDVWYPWTSPALTPIDTLYVAQMRASPLGAGGDVATTVVAVGSLTGVDLADICAQEPTCAAAVPMPPVVLAAPPSTGSLPIDWRTASFEAALPPPGAATGSHRIAVAALPGDAAAVWTVPPPEALANRAAGLTLLELDRTAPAADHDDGVVTWGRFLAAPWVEELVASYSFAPSGAAAGSGPALTDEVFVVAPVASWTGPILPGVSMVTSPTIAGSSAFSSQTGVGLTPAIAWGAPVTGTPTSYRVVVEQVVSAASPVPISVAAEFVTTATSVAVPAGILQVGSSYAVGFTARVSSADRPTTAPWATGATEADATVWSGVFTP